jgi:hypothetical protein
MYSSEPDLAEVVREAYGDLRLQHGADEANRIAVGNFLARLEPSLVYAVAGEGTVRVHRGRDEVETLLEDAAQDWQSCEFRLDWVETLEEDRIVAAGTCEARPPGGEPERFEFTAVWTFREGKAERIYTFPGRERTPGKAATLL